MFNTPILKFIFDSFSLSIRFNLYICSQHSHKLDCKYLCNPWNKRDLTKVNIFSSDFHNYMVSLPSKPLQWSWNILWLNLEWLYITDSFKGNALCSTSGTHWIKWKSVSFKETIYKLANLEILSLGVDTLVRFSGNCSKLLCFNFVYKQDGVRTRWNKLILWQTSRSPNKQTNLVELAISQLINWLDFIPKTYNKPRYNEQDW